MNTRRALTFTLCALILGTARLSRAEDGVTLTRMFKKGVTTRYAVKVNAKLGEMDVMVAGQSKLEVTDVKDNGEVTIIESDEGRHLTVGGQEQDAPATPPMTVTRDRLGRLIDFKLGEAAGGDTFIAPELRRLITAISEPVLPDKSVKSGDTWQVEQDDPMVKGTKFTIKGTYLGTEKLGDKTLWKLRETADPAVNADGGKMTSETTIWLDPSNGQLFKREQVLKDIPTQFGPVSWVATTELAAPK